jgi:D-alanyl-lipoteichoic acid acyltransferase DltB (MBOAT superfamily)
MRPWRSSLDFTLFVTFFPQLVAGPIVRARDFLPQCLEPRVASTRQLGWGMALIVLGLFEKAVMADSLLDPMVRAVYDEAGVPSTWLAWCATMAFAGQIFSDFGGYSLCAIGTALCLGFSLPDNFRFPYAAVGFSDFWRRWHISLSTWLRDYLYIPLGGNRQGRTQTARNLMITMLLGGLWHGAAWTFVAWGGLHGLYLLAERVLRRRFGHLAMWRTTTSQMMLAAITFGGVCFAWVFFRATSFPRAFTIARAMLGLAPGEAHMTVDIALQVVASLAIFAILVVHWLMRHRSLSDVVGILPGWVHSILIAAMLFSIVTISGKQSAFIYFQF